MKTKLTKPKNSVPLCELSASVLKKMRITLLSLVFSFLAINFSSGQSLLYSNGPFITHPNGGYMGFNWSKNSCYNDVNINSLNTKVADDFIINDIQWNIDSIVFFTSHYVSSYNTNSQVYRVYLRIWDGLPEQNGSNIVWGDLTTNLLVNTYFSGTIRGSDNLSYRSPVIETVCSTTGLVLTSGKYWLEWKLDSYDSEEKAVTITILNEYNTGNSLFYSNNQWFENKNVAINTFGRGLCFDIYGSKVAESYPFPIKIKVSDISADQSHVSWIAASSENNWVIEYGLDGFQVGNGTILQSSNNNIVLSGLIPNNKYNLYIKSDYGNGNISQPSFPIDFITDICDSSQKCNYSFYLENLNSGNSEYENQSIISVLENGRELYYSSFGTGGTGLMISCPICDSSLMEVSFIENIVSQNCTFSIRNSLNELVGECSINNDFNFYSNCSNPSCFKPSNLTSTSLSSTSVLLSWQPNGSEHLWLLEFDTLGFAQGSGTQLMVDTNVYPLYFLDSTKVYAYYVKSICDTGYSDPSEICIINPIIQTISNYPWFEGFEGNVFPPDGINTVDNDLDGLSWMLNTYSFFPIYQGSNSAYSYSNNSEDWIITPPFQINNQNLFFHFWISPYQNIDTIQYSVLVELINSKSSFNQIFNETYSGGWAQRSFPLYNYYNQTIRLAFKHTGMGYAFLDNLSVDITMEIDDTKNYDFVNIYPNPATNEVFITIPNFKPQTSNFKLFTIDGRKVLEGKLESPKTRISTKDLESGVYFIEVSLGNEKMKSKLVITK